MVKGMADSIRSLLLALIKKEDLTQTLIVRILINGVVVPGDKDGRRVRCHRGGLLVGTNLDELEK